MIVTPSKKPTNAELYSKLKSTCEFQIESEIFYTAWTTKIQNIFQVKIKQLKLRET